MADKKITELPAASGVTTDDLIPIVNAPGGTPETQKATVTQLRAGLVPIVLTADVSGVLPVANGGWLASTAETLTNKVINGASNTLTVRLANDVSGTLPVANGGTGITSFGAGVATWLGTPSSANLAAAVTDETGSGALVFANTPTLVTPVIGAATGTSLALSSFWSTGAAPASFGAGRMSNGDALYSRNSADTGDIRVIGASLAVIRVGGGAAGFDLDLCGDNAAIWNSDRTLPRVTFDSSACHIYTVPLWIRAQSGPGYSYKYATSAIAADRTITLPLLTGNDTFVFEAHTQTLTNKTISLGSNTVTFTSAQLKTACSDETGSGGALVFATGPTLSGPIINGQSQGGITAVSALEIDWSAGTGFTKTLAAGGNTFTFANQAANMQITVRLTSNAGGSTVTWPSVKWAGGVAPTQTSTGVDVYTFWHDGSLIYGSVVQAFA